MARNGSEDLEAKIYEMERILYKMGMAKRFSVVLDNSGNPLFLDKTTNIAYSSVQEVMNAAKRATVDVRKTKSREKNVSKDAKPVRVVKRESLSGKTGHIHDRHVGLDSDESILRSAQQRYRADKSRVEAYNRREKRNIVSIGNMDMYGNYTFKVNGATYQTLDSAFSAANDLKKRKSIRHFGNPKASAEAKVNELNRLAGYNRFSVVKTSIPGRASSTLKDSWSIYDKETNKTYAYGSIYGTFALSSLTNELKRKTKDVDAVSSAAPSTSKSKKIKRRGKH